MLLRGSHEAAIPRRKLCLCDVHSHTDSNHKVSFFLFFSSISFVSSGTNPIDLFIAHIYFSSTIQGVLPIQRQNDRFFLPIHLDTFFVTRLRALSVREIMRYAYTPRSTARYARPANTSAETSRQPISIIANWKMSKDLSQQQTGVSTREISSPIGNHREKVYGTKSRKKTPFLYSASTMYHAIHTYGLNTQPFSLWKPSSFERTETWHISNYDLMQHFIYWWFGCQTYHLHI